MQQDTNCGMGIGGVIIASHVLYCNSMAKGRCNLSTTSRRDPFDQMIDMLTIPVRFNSMPQKEYQQYQQEQQSPQLVSLSRRSSSPP